MWLMDHRLQPFQRFRQHAQLVQTQSSSLLVEQSQYHALTGTRGHRADPHIDFPTADPQGYAAVLRYAFFRDVESRHDLDTRYEQRRQFAFRLHDFAHHAVDAETHDHLAFECFDVDVGSALANRLGKQRVDEADDRCVVFLFQQIFGFRDGIGQAGQVHLFPEVFDHLAGLGRITRVGVREDLFEFAGVHVTQGEFALGQAPDLGQRRQTRLLQTDHVGASHRPAAWA